MGDQERVAPDSSQRKICYGARDAFYKCMAASGDDELKCAMQKQEYHSKCLSSWVRHFDRKRLYEEYKKKLETEGFQPADLKKT
ncbi:hypothetical protein EMCRGX_G032119 [Ephydatia muelleri]